MDRYRTGSAGNGGGYNPFAAGTKHYGGGRNNPTSGPLGQNLGYINRDAALKARRDAILRRLQSSGTGTYIQAGRTR